MTPDVREWVEKAEADFASALREIRARARPNHDLVCFLAQQSAEKYLKARLVESSTRFPRTHDLRALLELALPNEPAWRLMQGAADALTDYAVRFRYPGAWASKSNARDAVKFCTLIRESIRLSLGLPNRHRVAMKKRAASRGPTKRKSTGAKLK